MDNVNMAEINSEAECVTSEDLELIQNLARQLLPKEGTGERPQLLRDINRMLMKYDEQKLRFVYFFTKGLS